MRERLEKSIWWSMVCKGQLGLQENLTTVLLIVGGGDGMGGIIQLANSIGGDPPRKDMKMGNCILFEIEEISNVTDTAYNFSFTSVIILKFVRSTYCYNSKCKLFSPHFGQLLQLISVVYQRVTNKSHV